MSSIWRNSMPSSGSSSNPSSNKNTKNQTSPSNIQSTTSGSTTLSNPPQHSTKKTNTTGTKKKKTKKSDDATSSNTGSTFFATSFIPMHSASLLKGITPIMPGPKTLNQGGYLTMSSAPSLPPFPTSKTSQSPATTTTNTITATTPKPTTTYDSEEDLPSFSSNSSDQSDSSSDDSSNSDSSDSYSSASDSELKKKKKPTKKSTKKKDDKEEKKPKKKENKEKTKSKTQNLKNVEEEKKTETVNKDQAIMPPPKPIIQEQQPSNNTSSTPIILPTTTATSTTTASTTSTDPPVRTKRKYTRRKDKETTIETNTKESETQGKKKRKKREVTSEPVDITSPKKKQVKSQAAKLPPSTQDMELTIYATEDDEKLFMDRNEGFKRKSEDSDLFFGKNYTHEILRDELIGIPWCFVKDSELNGAEKSNSITYLDAIVQETQFILSSTHEVEDAEMKNTKEQIFEPALIDGMNTLIPIELIQNPELFNVIFSINTWNNILKEEHRMFLKQFLPPVLTSTLSDPHHNEEPTSTTCSIEEVKEEESIPLSREEEENEWKELMNGSEMRHKKTAATAVTTQSSKQIDSKCFPKSTDSPLLVKTLNQLFNKTPLLFNQDNDVTKLVKGIKNGIYHPTIQLEKQQMKYLLSINLKMEYHLYIECELLAKRRLSALQKMNTLKLALPPSLTRPNQATLAAIDRRKQILAEKNSKISLPSVQHSLFMEQTQMEPPTTTLAQLQNKETTEKQKPVSAPVKERKKPGPKPKKKKEVEPSSQFEFVNFKAKTSSSK